MVVLSMWCVRLPVVPHPHQQLVWLNSYFIQSDESAGVCLLKQAISNAFPQFYHDSITLMVQTVKDQAGV